MMSILIFVSLIELKVYISDTKQNIKELSFRKLLILPYSERLLSQINEIGALL